MLTRILLLVSLSATLVFAQFPPASTPPFHVRGALTSGVSFSGNDFTVEVTKCEGGRLIEQVSPARDGAFELRQAETGCAFVRVLGALDRKIVHEEVVQFGQHMPPIEIHLTFEKPERPASGSVSLKELRQPVPKKAIKLMLQANDLSKAGNHEGAIQKLRQALDICHGCGEAHINLGVQLIATNQLDAALLQFQSAVNASPTSSIAHANLAYSLIRAKRYTEAEAAARRAVALDRTSAKAHYLLGNALVAQGRSIPEALRELDIAASEIPRAKVLSTEVRSFLPRR